MNRFFRFLDGLLPGRRDEQLRQQERLEIMTALQNLTAAVATFATAVDAAVIVIQTDTPTEAQIQAAADGITAQAARLQAALTPPPKTRPLA